MKTQRRADTLMDAIRYQVHRPDVTTMGACPRCRQPSRGAQLCVECLTVELQVLIGPGALEFRENCERLHREKHQ